MVSGTRADALASLAAIPGILPPGTAMVADGLGADGTLAVTRLVLGERVLFDSGSDQPLPGAPAVLALVAEAARQAGPRTAVTVLGHTDSVGGDAYNMDLSQRRARAVIAALEQQGINPAALTAVAVGRRQPVASNATAEGRAANRRVEFLLSPSLAANLAAAAAQAGDGTVAVLRPGPDALLRPAGTLRLGPETMPVEHSPALRAVRPVHPAQPMLRLNQPEAVRPAPLGPAVTY